jgi:hypothetical protein
MVREDGGEEVGEKEGGRGRRMEEDRGAWRREERGGL